MKISGERMRVNIKKITSHLKTYSSGIIILSSIVILGIVQPVFAKMAPNFLSDIDILDSRDEMTIVLDFDRPVQGMVKPVFYKKSIQIDLPSVAVKKGRTLEVNNKMLNTVRLYPYQQGVVRMRLVLAKEGLNLRKGFQIKKTGNRILIRIEQRGGSGLRKSHKTPSRAYNEIDREIILALADAAEVGGEEKRTPTNTKKMRAEQRVKPVETLIDPKERKYQEEKKKDTFFMEETTGSSGALKNEMRSVVPNFLKMGGALAIVLALIFFSAVGARKVLSKKGKLFGNNKLVEVLASTQIGIKKSIMLADVGGEILVLGVSNDNITMLTKLEKEEAVLLVRNANKKGEIHSSLLDSVRGLWGGEKDSQRDTFSRQLDRSQMSQTNNSKAKEENIEDVARSIRERVELLKCA